MKYLLITFFRRPNGQIDEQVVIAKKLKPADLQTCNIIMNYSDKKVEKCVIEGIKRDNPWDQMNYYYKKIYPVLIEQLEREAELLKTESANPK